MRAISILSAVAAIGLALMLAGGEAQAADPKCGLNNGEKATGDPIPLGAITGRTGPTDFSSSAEAAGAYFKCVNDNGGINGRPIAFTIEDDGWKPEQSAAAAAKLVNDQGVYALIGNSSFVDCSANEGLYEKANVLVIAGVGIPRDCFFSKNYAQTNAGPRISNLGAAQYMVKTFGIKSIVCISPNIPGVGEFSCDGIKAWAEPQGIAYHLIVVDPAAVDATSNLLQAMSFKPDLIEISFPRDGVIAFLKAAEEQDLGATVKFSSPTSVYNLQFPDAIGPYWDGNFYMQLELEPFDKPTEDMQNWYAVLDKYAPADIQRDTFAQAGYLSARWITEIMLKMDPAKIDRASVTDTLLNMKEGYQSDIACGPWYFGPGARHNPNHAGSVAIIKGGKFETLAPCFEVEDPDLADVHQTEKDMGLN